MFEDPVSIVAAVAGGAVGLALMIRLGGFRVSRSDPAPGPPPQPRPTGYASTHPPTASPILTASGLAVSGVGIVLIPSIGVFSVAFIVLGGGLLAVAAVAWIRSGAGPASGDGTDGGDRPGRPNAR